MSLITLCVFLGVMVLEPRTLWSGVTFFWMMASLALFAVVVMAVIYAKGIPFSGILPYLLLILFVLALLCVLAFPVLLILVFFIQGIKVVRHEGLKPSNLLSVFFSVLLASYLLVWPLVGNLAARTIGTMLYLFVTFAAAYLLALMAMYAMSAILNLIHLRKKRRADYIVVLGAGLTGAKVTPLLAARIEKGMELLRRNPRALLIMSGGQGPGEHMPESEAMAAYAVEHGVDPEKILKETESSSTLENLRFSRDLMKGENPRIILVTTAYHVFRALVLARQEGIKCVGFGARTKWYFTLNAWIREFVGYLHLSWRRHAIVLGVVFVFACILTA